MVKEHPNMYLDEMVVEMARRIGKDVSITTIWCSWNYTAKDERTTCRQYGYPPRNKRAVKKVVYIRGTQYTLLSAMSLDNIITLDIMQGSCNKERFFKFILAKVLPNMNLFPRINIVLAMDNAQIHHSELLVNFTESVGYKIYFFHRTHPI
uniref:Tc1-like transposase DDE domain-containing protein n=1 Tax=Rhizophagus irregularis (strain DAOM 181602 / DAOM 197198 / MUCL 43194) TaxID=747089 RepID=U9UNK3_RHIID